MSKRGHLHDIDIIAELPEKEREFVYRASSRKNYPKGRVIHAPGGRDHAINYVLSGRVKIYDLSAWGREIIYRYCPPGSFFGIAQIFGGEEREVFAEAVEDTEVLCVDKAIFEQLVRKNPAVALSVIAILAGRIRQAHKAIKEFALCDVRSRTAQLLIKLAQMGGSSDKNGAMTIQNKFTHQELANMIGATRQTVTEVMNDLKRKGYIRCPGGRITILDSEGLERLING